MRKIYTPSIPRTALATISVLSAAITMSAMVLLPAKLEFVDGDQRGVAVARSTPIEVVSRETGQLADELQADSNNRYHETRALATHAAVRERK